MNDYARSRMTRRGRDGRHMGGQYRGGMDFRGDYAMTDGRQGVRGTGRYGMGGSMYRGRRDRAVMDYNYTDNDMYDYDMDDYSYGDDYADYDYARGGGRRRDYAMDEPMHLTKREMQEWKRRMQNADGSLGEHFSGDQIKSMAEKLGVRYNGYDEKELCVTVNMLYSDYCEALRGVIPPEKELMIYTKLGKAWLEDEDAPEGSEKLALYFRCIACDEEM